MVPAQLMKLTLSCDHRILYGAEGAEFLARVRALLEEPVGLAL
ncbi:MAG TPA: 2-oxo acid dehydrogenase subunit E2 [Solirubrobacterales bacterium]